MDDLADFTSEIIEFKPTLPTEKLAKLNDKCIATDPMPAFKDANVATNGKVNAATQCEVLTLDVRFDERKLANWLRKICPMVEAELIEGPSPLSDCYQNDYDDVAAKMQNIQTYQKISINDALENSQGLAIWLSVHSNSAPLLVVTAMATHDDWCEHVNQSLHLFIPKRVNAGNFIVFTPIKTIPVKACVHSLCTNPFNKNIFAGSTMDGNIYIWRYEMRANVVEIDELFSFTSQHGTAEAMDWSNEHHLVTAHSNGFVLFWLVSTQMVKEKEHLLVNPIVDANAAGTSANANANANINSNANVDKNHQITALICLNANEFVVGTNDGRVLHCWDTNFAAPRNQLKVTILRKHLFMVSTLLKTKVIGGHRMQIISCDLSGEVYFHDVTSGGDEEDGANVSVQIPLPFKNAIACSLEGDVIYCPGADGALECYRIADGLHTIIKGALRGKGNLIKRSDNGFWIITGLYDKEFQIFYIEN